jgi:hypothetical protein
VHGELVPVPRSTLDVGGSFAPVARTARVGLGLMGLVAHGAYVAVGGRPRTDAVPDRGPALWAGAALGLAMEAERRAVRAAEAMVSAGSTAARGMSQLPVVKGPTSRFESWLVRWNARGRVQQRRNQAEADVVLRRTIQQVMDAVLDHVDFAHIVKRIPMDEIVENIDLEAIIQKMDIGSVIGVAMKEIDLAGIIRESTEGVTAEAVDVVRSQTVKSDVFVSRIVDRVMFRKTPRDLSLTEPTAPDGDGDGGSEGSGGDGDDDDRTSDGVEGGHV